MSGLSPRAREMFERARAAGAPSAAERDRLYRRLAAMIDAGAAADGSASTTSPSEAPASTAAPSAGGALGGQAVFAGIALGVATAVALSASLWALTPRSTPPEPRSAAPGPAADARDAGAKDAGAADARPAEIRRNETAPPNAAGPVERLLPSRGAPDDDAQDLAAELALLRRAQAARHEGRTEDALRALDAHERRFPRGVLANEREIARALVLCESGDTAGGRAIAAQLGDSAWSGSLARTCGPNDDETAP